MKLASIRRGWRWKGFPPAVFVAMVFVFTRCIYRVIELQEGFDGSLANDEVAFMILEGPMIIIAMTLVLIWHPGVAFQGRWSDAAWKINGRDETFENVAEKRPSESSSETAV